MSRYHDTRRQFFFKSELEFELIHNQMAQKPLLRADLYARALRASQKEKRVDGVDLLDNEF